jgi:hypothetical protein
VRHGVLQLQRVHGLLERVDDDDVLVDRGDLTLQLLRLRRANKSGLYLDEEAGSTDPVVR